MSNTTITNLPAATALNGSEEIPAVQSRTSVRVTAQQIANLAPAAAGGVTSLAVNSPLYASPGSPITTTGAIGILTNGINNTYLAQMPTLTLKGNALGTTATPQDLTVAQVQTLLGLPGTIGTVTSVNVVGGSTGLSFTGGPITGAGTITAGGTLGIGYGGTGLAATPASGQFLVGTGTGYALAPLTAGSNISIVNGTTISATALGTVTQVNTGTGLTGGPITSSGTISLANTGVVSGVYGSASIVPTITVNAQGQITNAADVSISIPSSAINTAIPNSGLAYSSITINGTAVSLGGSITISTSSGLTVGSTPISGGTAGAVLYQSGTSLGETAVGNTGQVLLSNGTASPVWASQSSLSVGTATDATYALNIFGGTGNQIPYQTASSTTSFIAAPTVANTFLEWTGTGFAWAATGSGSGTVTSVQVTGGTTGLTTTGGPITSAGTIVIGGTLATGSGGTGLSAAPTNGQLLIGNGTGYTLNTLTAGTGISISNAAGSITIASTGTAAASLSVGSSPIAGGATGRVLYDNAGTLGEYTITGTAGSVVMSNSPTLVTPNIGSAAATNITTTDYITFNNTPATSSTAVGTMFWDGVNSAILQMDANVQGALNESEYIYVKASSAITIGQLVYFTGAVGASSVVTVAPTVSGITNATYIIGIAAESIALNGFGLIQLFGPLKGFDTTGSTYGQTWATGDVLYYDSVGGGLTNVYPTSGIIVEVAAVTNAGTGGSGSVLIRPKTQQRITAGTGISVSQTAAGATISQSAANVLTIGTSTVSGGTNTDILFNNNGTLGQYAISGTGTTVAMATSPSLTTPNIGAATATSVNGLSITSTTGTLAIANSSTLATSGAFSTTLTSTGATNVTLPTSGTLVTTTGTVAAATNISGGLANKIPYQTAPGTTSFITAPTTASTFLEWNGTSFTWAAAGGGGGGFTLLASGVTNLSGTADVLIKSGLSTTSYKQYMLVLSNVSTTSSGNAVYLRYGTTSAEITSNYYYAYRYISTIGVGQGINGNLSGYQVLLYNGSTTSSGSCCIFINNSQPNVYPVSYTSSGFFNQGTTQFYSISSGATSAAFVLDGIYIGALPAPISNVAYALYGM